MGQDRLIHCGYHMLRMSAAVEGRDRSSIRGTQGVTFGGTY